MIWSGPVLAACLCDDLVSVSVTEVTGLFGGKGSPTGCHVFPPLSMACCSGLFQTFLWEVGLLEQQKRWNENRSVGVWSKRKVGVRER